MVKTELFWFAGSFLLASTVVALILLFQNSFAHETMSFNFYDTYFVVDKMFVVLSLITLTYFLIYLFRTVSTKFVNTVSSLILGISAGLLIIVISEITEVLESATGWTVVPPNGLESDNVNLQANVESLNPLSAVLKYTRIGLLLLMLYTFLTSLIKLKHSR